MDVEQLFYLLVLVQIFVGVYLLWTAWQWLNYARLRMSVDPGLRQPRIALLCPCKGMEANLERNLVALTEFSNQNYELFFILASQSDPAFSLVKRVAASSRPKAHVIIAGQPQGCGEKVNNLRVALEQLPADFEILVFADSDGLPGKSWLNRLVAPLSDPRIASRIGATTTMRWFIPNRRDLSSAVLAAWNAPIVTMLSEKGENFCWGGGTAIRRSIFEQSGVAEEWNGSISDDYSMTRALERSRHAIMFLPECLTLSFVETDPAGLFEFTNRQIIITRVYAPKVWRAAAATNTLYCFTLTLGALLTASNVLAGRPSFHILALTALPMLLNAIRAAMRVTAVTEILDAWRNQLLSAAWLYIVIGLFIPFLYVANSLFSLFTRKIQWRGIRYQLNSPQDTRILSA
ncbi:MAG: glycosyltransferase family 2 protein [Candidatus Acidiferrum sp.]